MLTLLTTFIGFLSGGLPSILQFFQDRTDKTHELAMMELQFRHEFELKKAGYDSLIHTEENALEQIKIQASTELQKTQAEANAQEIVALYKHDADLGSNASTWIINLRASVSPIITYGFFITFFIVKIFTFIYALRMNTPFLDVIKMLWDIQTAVIFETIIGFYFGKRAFNFVYNKTA